MFIRRGMGKNYFLPHCRRMFICWAITVGKLSERLFRITNHFELKRLGTTALTTLYQSDWEPLTFLDFDQDHISKLVKKKYFWPHCSRMFIRREMQRVPLENSRRDKLITLYPSYWEPQTFSILSKTNFRNWQKKKYFLPHCSRMFIRREVGGVPLKSSLRHLSVSQTTVYPSDW